MSDEGLEFYITCKECGVELHCCDYEWHLEEEHDHVPLLNGYMFNFY